MNEADDEKRLRPLIVKILRIVFLVAAIAAASVLLAQESEAIVQAIESAQLPLVALALLAAIGNVGLTGVSWRALMARAPAQLSLAQSARIFFVGQIGKYLPGTVWSFLASAELAKDAGLDRKITVASFLLALFIGLATGVVIALVFVPQATGWVPQDRRLAALAALFLSALLHPAVRRFLSNRAKITFPLPPTTLAISVGVAFLAWFLAGLQLMLLGEAIGAFDEPVSLLHLTGIYAFAWITGFLFVIAPAGLGAREASLLALLSISTSLAEATVIVLLSRLVVTLADFAAAGFTLVLTRAPAQRQVG